MKLILVIELIGFFLICFNEHEKLSMAQQPSVPLGKYPFYVYLRADDVICGGALISRKHVITAAHCVYHKHCIEGSFGMVIKMNATQQDRTDHLDYPEDFAEEICYDEVVYNHDIAILTYNVDFIEAHNPNMNLINLSETPRDKLSNGAYKVLGFGSKNQHNDLHVTSAKILDQTSTDADVWDRGQFQFSLPDDENLQILGKYDDGGPIFEEVNNIYTLVGIVIGSTTSGDTKLFDATSTFEYLDWIKNIISL